MRASEVQIPIPLPPVPLSLALLGPHTLSGPASSSSSLWPVWKVAWLALCGGGGGEAWRSDEASAFPGNLEKVRAQLNSAPLQPLIASRFQSAQLTLEKGTTEPHAQFAKGPSALAASSSGSSDRPACAKAVHLPGSSVYG